MKNDINVTMEQVHKLAGRWVRLHRMATQSMKQEDEQKWKLSYGKLSELQHAINIIDRDLYVTVKSKVHTSLVKEYGSEENFKEMNKKWDQWRQKLTHKEWRKSIGLPEEAER